MSAPKKPPGKNIYISVQAYPTYLELTHVRPRQQIVNKVYRPDSGDIDRLARWIRCLFSLALSSNAEMSENIVDQVISIAGSAKEVCLSVPRTFCHQYLSSLQERGELTGKPQKQTETHPLPSRRARMDRDDGFQPGRGPVLRVAGRGVPAVGGESDFAGEFGRG